MTILARLTYGLVAALILFTSACGGGGEEPSSGGEQPGTAGQQQAPVQGDTSAGAGATTDAAGGAGGEEALIAQGQEIFTGAGICFTCHNQDATGTQLAPDLTDDTWINIEEPVTVEKIVQLVRTGVQEPKEHPAPMPAMGGANLSDDQLQAVATYVYSISH